MGGLPTMTTLSIGALLAVLIGLSTPAAVPPCPLITESKLSNGTSGELCGKFKCHTNATCVNGTCVCPEDEIGDGRLMCAPNTTIISKVIGDPVMCTMDNMRAHVPYPCRYLLTHIITTHSVGESGGTCDFKIFGLNYFVDNGYYLLGFDLEAKLIDNLDPSIRAEGGIRLQGVENSDGQFRYVEFGKENSLSKRNPWQAKATNITYENIVVQCMLDLENNIVTLDVPECGVKISFRAFVRQSQQLPGFFLSIEDRPGLTFIDAETTLLSTPFNFDTPNLKELKDLYNLTTSEASLFLALNQDVRQDFGMGAIPCTIATKQFTQVCREPWEQAFAMKTCSFLYTEKKIAGCLLADVFGESIGSMFAMCVQAMCWRHEWLCEDVKDTLLCYGCTDIPASFASLDCGALNMAIAQYDPNPM